MWLLLTLACPSTPEKVVPEPTETTSAPDVPPVWDAAGPVVDCTAGAAAPLLDAALADAELDRDLLGYTEADWSDWSFLAADDFEFSWWVGVHNATEQVPCFGRQVQSDLDTAAAAAHPVAATLGAWAPWMDVALAADPIDPTGLDAQVALSRLNDVAGGDRCTVDGLDPDLAAALAPIFEGLAAVIEARLLLDADAADHFSVKDLYNGAPGTVLYGKDPVPVASDSDGLRWFTRWFTGDSGPKSLLDPARQLAFAVEDADLARFAGGSTDWTCTTTRGDLRVSPATDDAHGADEPNHLFHLELGGNDVYTGPAGATADKDQAVAVLVDLGGADTYSYEEVPDDADGPGTLVSDDDGRYGRGDYNFSLSDHPRQGAGRYGVGLLFDLGGGADHYLSLRMSQGFGALGVGVLLDDGGDDVYEGEGGVQGAAVFGWGFLLDLGGTDTYRAWAQSQGFAYVHSGGVLYDVDGDDTYWADPGNNYGGTTLYYSPQLAGGEGNSSFCQGAGFGMRDDADGVYLSGGLGTLRDLAGSDTYTAGVFSQATGYWKGTGLLADADGDDSYDALWYIQGGAAHFAMAILMEGGGDDLYNPTFVPYNVSLGSGHDFSVGVVVDEAGNDTVRSTSLGIGASNCQGVGVYVDNAGDDTYVETSTASLGLGNHSGECNEATGRTAYPSVGLFVDAAGTDTYTWIEGDSRHPADDSEFGLEANGTADEHGGAVDGAGESGFHAR